MKLKLSIYAIGLVSLLQSCTLIKQIKAEETTFKENASVKFDVVKNRMYIDTYIDGSSLSQSFLYDTGFTFTTIHNSSLIKDFDKKTTSSIGTTKSINNEKVQSAKLNVDLETGLFKSKDMFVSYFEKATLECSKATNYEGVIGSNAFSNNNRIVLINFDEQKISNINSSSIEGFKEVNSKIKMAHFYIELNINNNKNFYLFDTGNSGNIYTKNAETSLDDKYLNQTREGISVMTANALDNFSISKTYKNVPVNMNGSNYLASVSSTSTIERYNVGMNFIQNFNWILDFKNKKMYYSLRKQQFAESSKSPNDYFVIANNGKVSIINKNVGATKYKLNDEIVEVNEEKVTLENQCKIVNLLNSSENWDTLKIKIK